MTISMAFGPLGIQYIFFIQSRPDYNIISRAFNTTFRHEPEYMETSSQMTKRFTIATRFWCFNYNT